MTRQTEDGYFKQSPHYKQVLKAKKTMIVNEETALTTALALLLPPQFSAKFVNFLIQRLELFLFSRPDPKIT